MILNESEFAVIWSSEWVDSHGWLRGYIRQSSLCQVFKGPQMIVTIPSSLSSDQEPLYILQREAWASFLPISPQEPFQMSKVKNLLLVLTLMISGTATVHADDVDDFVNRMYTVIFNRPADTAGFNDWTTRLRNGTASGSDIAFGFLMSAEYGNTGARDHHGNWSQQVCY